MSQAWLAFGIGLAVGGLGLSACWGLFWLVIGTTGLARRTCGWRAVLNSLTVGAVPLLLIAGLLWLLGGTDHIHPGFGAGLPVMPMVLAWVGLRRAPDGRRAVAHMLEGVRQLMDELLGRHQACAGCGEGHRHETSRL
ncbi:MAG: hypothetical protein ACT4O4_11925 [Nitrospiraceae bacterium]